MLSRRRGGGRFAEGKKRLPGDCHLDEERDVCPFCSGDYEVAFGVVIRAAAAPPTFRLTLEEFSHQIMALSAKADDEV